jgi:hypothetical protein
MAGEFRGGGRDGPMAAVGFCGPTGGRAGPIEALLGEALEEGGAWRSDQHMQAT